MALVNPSGLCEILAYALFFKHNTLVARKGFSEETDNGTALLSFLRRQETRQCMLDSHFRENEGQG